jgi:hypothetical protein
MIDESQKIKRISITHVVVQMILLILYTVAAPSYSVYPFVAGLPLYVFWVGVLLPAINFANVGIWIVRLGRIELERWRRGEEEWR